MGMTALSAERVYRMLGNETLWETAARCHELLTRAGIPYCVCGGVAVCLHGYQRNTVDLDLIARKDDAAPIHDLFLDAGFSWDEDRKDFQSQSGIAVQFIIAGEKAGKDSEVAVAEPIGELNVEEREGLVVVRLSRLIEMKLACGLANLRRTHKDFADVVELISIRKLDSGFARYLHPSLRDAFRKPVSHAAGGE
jgi:hypothetical protein